MVPRDEYLEARGHAVAVGDGEQALAIAKKLMHGKLTAIEKLAARKLNPMPIRNTPRQELNRIWNASDANQKVVLRLHVLRWCAALGRWQ